MAAATDSQPRSWASLEPNHNGDGFHWNAIKERIVPGTFVLLQNGNQVARTVNTMSDGTLEVNLFERLGEDFHFADSYTPTPLSLPHLRYLQEVVQTREVKHIRSEDMKDLAFVFQACDFTNGKEFCYEGQGMDTVFILWYQYDTCKKAHSIIPEGHCLAFPSCYDSFLELFNDCFAFFIWRQVITLKQALSTFLGRSSQNQASFFE